MGIFDKLNEPVIIKDSSSAKEQLAAIEPLMNELDGKTELHLSKDIAILKAGIFGEDNILFELKNSHMPMYVLQDIYVTEGNLSAQIDFIVVTRKITYIIECKNLLGNIEVRNNGDFIRTLSLNGRTLKEGIYSPITQNERHLELIRKKRANTKGVLGKLLFGRYFDNFNRAIVVLANPKTVLNDRYAPKNIKSKLIRADQLIRYIKETNAASKEESDSDKDMLALANSFLAMHEERVVDYTAKYRTFQESIQNPSADVQGQICPRCGKQLVQRKGKFGMFWGCIGYPTCKHTQKIE